MKNDFLKVNIGKKKGKLLTSHRYNRIPLLPSGPGGVLRELVVWDLPGHKYNAIAFADNLFFWQNFMVIFWLYLPMLINYQ